jgi:hypothetical protein
MAADCAQATALRMLMAGHRVFLHMVQTAILHLISNNTLHCYEFGLLSSSDAQEHHGEIT